MNGNWQDWTPCQMYGHIFERDEDNPNRFVCRECGENYSEEEESCDHTLR